MIPCFTRTCHLLSHSGSPLSVHELHESVCGQMTQLQPKSLHSQWHFKCQCHISSGSYASSDPNAETRSHILKTPPESIFTMVQSPECRRNSLFQTDCLIHSSTWMTCWSSVTKDTLKASLFLSHTHTHMHTQTETYKYSHPCLYYCGMAGGSDGGAFLVIPQLTYWSIYMGFVCIR